MIDSRFIFGFILGVVAVYGWHHYQASKQG